MDSLPVPFRTERFEHADLTLAMLLPASPEDLIDVSDFNVDERLPYWADLWPSARALAAHLLDSPELPRSVIELGCGVALPSLVLRHRGLDPLATDWYEDALHYARLNAEQNALGPLQTMQLDWRTIPDDMRGRFALAIAADVLYEERNIETLCTAIDGLVAPDGAVLIADPGRTYLPGFLQTVSDGWTVDDAIEREEPPQIAGGEPGKIRIYRLRRRVVGLSAA